MDFETKLAAAGDILEKLAAEQGLNVRDFTENEITDLLTTIMGDDTSKVASEEPQYAAQEQQYSEQPQGQLTYGQVMAEVVKVASANGYDIGQATPEQLDEAVQKMASVLSTPGYFEKQAALNEKVAEADAMGRIMAHAYVDELGKLAAAAEGSEAEKRASFIGSVKAAADMPEQFKHQGHEKCKECGKHPCECKEEKEEKKASFAKAASDRAAELLIYSGINPSTGEKFASEQEALDAGAKLILQSKGYV